MINKLFNFFKQKSNEKELDYITKQEIIKQIGIKNPVILEAGACEGYDTEEWAILMPKAEIHSFEPVLQNYELTKERVKNYKNVKIYNLALSDKAEKTEIYVSKNLRDESSGAAQSSILSPKEVLNTHQYIKFPEKQEVQSINLDEWAEKNNVNRIDFMWLDLQGAEYKVLKAAPKILSTVKVLHTEVSFKEMYDDSILYPEFKDWLSSQGFKVIKEDLRYEDMGDALLVRQ